MNLKISRIIDTYTAKLASIFISEIKLAQDRFKFNHYCNLFFCILCITLRVLISNSSFQRIKFAVQTPKTFQKIGIFVLSVTQYSGLSTYGDESCTSPLHEKINETKLQTKFFFRVTLQYLLSFFSVIQFYNFTTQMTFT